VRQACIEAFVQENQINKGIMKHYWHTTGYQFSEKMTQTLLLLDGIRRLEIAHTTSEWSQLAICFHPKM